MPSLVLAITTFLVIDVAKLRGVKVRVVVGVYDKLIIRQNGIAKHSEKVLVFDNMLLEDINWTWKIWMDCRIPMWNDWITQILKK